MATVRLRIVAVETGEAVAAPFHTTDPVSGICKAIHVQCGCSGSGVRRHALPRPHRAQ